MPELSDGTIFLILVALTATIGGWGLLRLLMALGKSDDDRMLERLAGEARHELHDSGRHRLLQQAEDEHWPAVLRPVLKRNRDAFPGIHPVGLAAMVAGLAALAGALVGIYSSWLAGAIAAIAILVGASAFIGIRSGRRQRLMADQLMDAMDFLARALRAGHSLGTGFQMIGEEFPDPLASEFRRCHEQISLGHTLDGAMVDMAKRIRSSDFAFFVTSVLIQRQTGGDLAVLLENIAGVVRKRIRLHQQTQALTAEGRLSGHILTVLPVGMFFLLLFIRADYVNLLTTTSMGRWLLAGAGAFIILGQLLIKRLVTIKV